MRPQYPGLDLAKYIASLFVICIHFNPLTGHPPYDMALNQAARFAVPFFFIASGYLFFTSAQTRPRAEWRALTYGMVRRLVGLLAFWWVLNIPVIWQNHISGKGGFWVGLRYYRTLVDRGVPWTPAWFFVALIIAMLVVSELRQRGVRSDALVVLALPLFVVGVLASQYLGDLPMRVQNEVWQFNLSVFSLQAGPLTGIFWVAMGAWFAEQRGLVHRSSVLFWWVVFACGVALAWIECSKWVNRGIHGLPDQYVALLLLAPAVFVLSLRWKWPVPGAVFLRNASTVNFVAQFLLVWIFAFVLGHKTLGWQRTAFVVAGGIVLTFALGRLRMLRVPVVRRLLRNAY